MPALHCQRWFFVPTIVFGDGVLMWRFVGDYFSGVRFSAEREKPPNPQLWVKLDSASPATPQLGRVEDGDHRLAACRLHSLALPYAHAGQANLADC
jgi:hypothetical protein